MKAAAIVCFVLALAVLGYWAASGMHFATRTEIPPEKHLSCATAADCGAEGDVCTDGKCFDDFGDPKPGKEWQKTFELGIVDGAGPAAGGLVFIGAVLFFLDRRKRRRAA
ncbi:MAG: hypothetical protein R3F65_06505 [bacterium]